MAEHMLTGESVAIKILEKARIRDKKDIERISREIKILKKMRHPNVIQLYEVSRNWFVTLLDH
jgi:serine/threonine protein kinase